MNAIVRQYRQYRKMQNEIYALREENKYLRDWLQQYEDAEKESQAASREGVRGILELVKYLTKEKQE